MGQLTGKVAIVTGASRGIGAAVVRRFCREGAHVVASHHDSPAMTELAETLVAELRDDGHQALAIPTDVSDPAQISKLVEATTDAFGPADVLVTNAAAFSNGPWHEVTDDEWDRIFDVNARGTFLCAKAVLPAMIARGSGSIITVSSVTTRVGLVGMLPYVASKGAVVALTRSLAREVGTHGVRVNSVMPGAIRTEHEDEMGHGDDSDQIATRLQAIPERLGAEELTGTFTYLASDDSRLLTGQVIAVDGGWIHR